MRAVPGLYPVTIFRTRYQGVYEGGAWAALVCDPEDVPAEAIADDVTCGHWWGTHGSGLGVGASPQEALDALAAIPDTVRWTRSMAR